MNVSVAGAAVATAVSALRTATVTGPDGWKARLTPTVVEPFSATVTAVAEAWIAWMSSSFTVTSMPWLVTPAPASVTTELSFSMSWS